MQSEEDSCQIFLGTRELKSGTPSFLFHIAHQVVAHAVRGHLLPGIQDTKASSDTLGQEHH